MKTNSKKNQIKAQSRPEQSSTNKLPKLDFKLRYRNRQLPAEKLMELMLDEAPQFYQIASVVGTWVWISFKQKQPASVTLVLSQLGFHWNYRRQLWQHPCGSVFLARSAKQTSANG